MSKELPYFKFYPDEWMTGDITLQSWSIQGIFINVCAYYWKRNGDVTLTKLRQRFANISPKIWEKLEKSDLILVETSGKVFINFLDEQLLERAEDHETHSVAGKKGAEKRWHSHSGAINVPMAKHGNIDKDIDKDIDKEEDKALRPKASKTDFIDQIIEQFVEAHGDYTITSRGKEREAAGRLLGIFKKKYPGATSEEMLAGLREFFDRCIKINDEWLRTNMSLPIIISQFNKIKAILKNGESGKSGGVSTTELANLIATRFGSDSKE